MVWLELINVAKKKKENKAFHSSEESSLQNKLNYLTIRLMVFYKVIAIGALGSFVPSVDRDDQGQIE
jgi:hypothetical protein